MIKNLITLIFISLLFVGCMGGGAKVENILNFQNDFNNCEVIKLEQNYRSVEEIVNAASNLIKKNSLRSDKSVFTKNKTKEDEGIIVKFFRDELIWSYRKIQVTAQTSFTNMHYQKPYNFVSDFQVKMRLSFTLFYMEKKIIW